MARYKMNKTNKDNELFWYLDSKKQKRWAYRHRYYDGFRKRKEKSASGFESENVAYRELLRVKQEILDGNLSLVENENLTVGQWAEKWLESQRDQWKITTVLQRQKIIEQQIKPLLGNYKLSKLDKITYKKAYIDELLKKYSVNTVKLYHRIFKICVNGAVDHEIITRNRFTKITIKNTGDKIHESAGKDVRENVYTPDELSHFLKCCKEQENITVQTIFITLASTGMRRGELAALRWQNIDFENNTLSIGRTRDRHGERATKTSNSIRTLDMNPSLARALDKYQKWCKQYRLAHGLQTKDDDYVFISYQTCEAISDTFISAALSRIIKRNDLKNITPHGFRHTFATILINEGVPVTTIAKLLGNTAKMVLEVYSHSFKELEERATKALANVVNFD